MSSLTTYADLQSMIFSPPFFEHFFNIPQLSCELKLELYPKMLSISIYFQFRISVVPSVKTFLRLYSNTLTNTKVARSKQDQQSSTSACTHFPDRIK